MKRKELDDIRKRHENMPLSMSYCFSGARKDIMTLLEEIDRLTERRRRSRYK